MIKVFVIGWWKKWGEGAAVPLSPFYPEGCNDKVIRLCFAKYEETLDKVAEKLCGL